MERSTNNKRIAKNTLYLYIRMLLIMAVSLYTSRVVLQVLGVEDFGIYNVVGGLVSIFAFFTSSLSNASQRYISVGLGKNDIKETGNAFRQSLTLMLFLSLILLLIGETVGLWFVLNKLVIPIERLNAAVWVYHFSLISVVCSINQVSFLATIVAHERMTVYAYLGIFEAISRLLIAFVIIFIESMDSLILYGLLIAFISIITFLFHLFYCTRNFEECKISLYWNRKLIGDMGSFIGYNLFGCFAWSAGIQGSNILLNMFFGPTVNAARAISMQVSTIVTRFTDSIMTAVKPSIIKSYVANEREYMFILIEKSSKYGFFLTALFAVPIMFEIEFILQIWLGQVPAYSVVFTRMVLCDALFGVFASSLWVAANATGNIKNNQVYGRIITLLILPVSYCLLLVYINPIVPFAVSMLSSFLYWGYCFFDIHKQLGLTIRNYIKSVITPSFIFVSSLFFVNCIIVNAIDKGSIIRFFLLLGISIFVGCIIIYLLLDTNERNFIKNNFAKILKK